MAVESEFALRPHGSWLIFHGTLNCLFFLIMFTDSLCMEFASQNLCKRPLCLQTHTHKCIYIFIQIMLP
uniref:Uncharacterized protein n=1 Tax=Octopus bimaculoides TaxID=37653 RepID=A0A0L8I8H1_OCTBM